MRAVIVAAGMGRRLEAATQGAPKCLVEVGGRPLVQRALDALESRGVRETLIVVGHAQEAVRAAVGDRARFIVNPFYRKTNNMASLWLAVPHVWDEPFLYLHSDVAFEEDLLDPLLEDTADAVALLVDPDSIDEEAMKVRLDGDRFIESSKKIPLSEAAGEWTGLARFTPLAARQFFDHAGFLLTEGEHQGYDTAAFNRMAAEGNLFSIVPTKGRAWCEIDTPQDLARARDAFPIATDAREGTA